jgi:hypothetical protein
MKELCKLTHRVNCPDSEFAILKFGKQPTLVGPKEQRDQFFHTFLPQRGNVRHRLRAEFNPPQAGSDQGVSAHASERYYS